MRESKVIDFSLYFKLATSETFSRKKVSNTSKSVQGEGKRRKLLRLSFSSPLQLVDKTKRIASKISRFRVLGLPIFCLGIWGSISAH
jgi:hypothetical protein